MTANESFMKLKIPNFEAALKNRQAQQNAIDGKRSARTVERDQISSIIDELTTQLNEA